MAVFSRIQFRDHYEGSKLRRFADEVTQRIQNVIQRLGLLEERSRFAYKVISSASVTDYTILHSDYTITVDTTDDPVTIKLPAIPEKVGYSFRVGKSNSGSNNITVNGNGNNINGSGTQVFNTQYKFYLYQWSGTEWFIVSST